MEHFWIREISILACVSLLSDVLQIYGSVKPSLSFAGMEISFALFGLLFSLALLRKSWRRSLIVPTGVSLIGMLFFGAILLAQNTLADNSTGTRNANDKAGDYAPSVCASFNACAHLQDQIRKDVVQRLDELSHGLVEIKIALNQNRDLNQAVLEKLNADTQSQKRNERLVAVAQRIVPHVQTPDEALHELESIVDITSGLAASYYHNFLRHLIDRNGPVSSHAVEAVYLIKPDMIRNFSARNKAFNQAIPKSRLSEASTLDAPSHPRQKIVVNLIDQHVVIDYPAIIDALQYSLAYKGTLQRLPFRDDQARADFEKNLIDAFFWNIERLVEADDHVSKDYVTIVSEADFKARVLGL